MLPHRRRRCPAVKQRPQQRRLLRRVRQCRRRPCLFTRLLCLFTRLCACSHTNCARRRRWCGLRGPESERGAGCRAAAERAEPRLGWERLRPRGAMPTWCRACSRSRRAHLRHVDLGELEVVADEAFPLVLTCRALLTLRLGECVMPVGELQSSESVSAGGQAVGEAEGAGEGALLKAITSLSTLDLSGSLSRPRRRVSSARACARVRRRWPSCTLANVRYTTDGRMAVEAVLERQAVLMSGACRLSRLLSTAPPGPLLRLAPWWALRPEGPARSPRRRSTQPAMTRTSSAPTGPMTRAPWWAAARTSRGRLACRGVFERVRSDRGGRWRSEPDDCL